MKKYHRLSFGQSLKSRIIENAILKTGDWVLGTTVIQQLKQQRTYSRMNAVQLTELQLHKLKNILKHATTTCVGYQKYAATSEHEVLQWLNTFPVLSKKDLVGHTDQFISNQFQKEQLIKYESSGSSGVRSVVYLDEMEQSIIRAILIHWWEWNGYYFGKPVFQTGMSPERGLVKRLKDFFLATTYMNAFGLSENEILESLSPLKGKKGMLLFGYASSLYELARVANKHQTGIKFDLAMSQGDKLFDHYQKEIQQAFGCEVVEDYGLNEGIMIGQKQDLPYFYVYTPSVYLEILDEHDQPVKEGEMGRIVATKLDGYAMPLIRYDTGDLGVMLPKEKYPVKRNFAFPLLEKVVGRNTDIIKTPDGKTLIVHTFTGIFEFYPEIVQFQVVQENLEEITIRYIPSETFDVQVLAAIETDFRGKTKSDIRMVWEKVSDIKPSKSGKPQIVVNHLIHRSLTDINT